MKCIFNLLIFFQLTYGFSQTNTSISVIDFSNSQLQEIIVNEVFASQEIHVSNPKRTNSIIINDAIEIDSIYVIANKFVLIRYRSPGGSGNHIRTSKMFCIKDGIIKESLTLVTLRKSYNSEGTIVEDYQISINYVTSNELSLHIQEYSLNDTIEVYNEHEKILVFDQSNSIFYSYSDIEKVLFCDNYSVDNSLLFYIDLGKEKYVYFMNSWYEEGSTCYHKI